MPYSADHSPRDWGRIKDAFARCQGLGPSARTALLDQLFATEPALKAEVIALLNAPDSIEMALEQPAGARLLDTDGPFAPPTPPSLTGKILGRYQIGARIGEGGTAEVYRARLKGTQGFQKEYAIKRVLPFALQGDLAKQLFEAEAKLCAQFNHRNIVHIFDFFSEGPAYYMVMELIEGRSLSSLIKDASEQKNRLPLDCALFVGLEVARGLDYAHTKKRSDGLEALGIVHRDISPKNVMIATDGTVKLIDFGIAKAKTRVDLTSPGQIRGTIRYMAPEQAKGEDVDARADLYSLGIVITEMIAGYSPFPGDNAYELLKAVAEGTTAARFIDALPAPAELRQVLRKATGARKEDRFASAAQFLSALEIFSERSRVNPNQKALQRYLEAAAASRPIVDVDRSAPATPATPASPAPTRVARAYETTASPIPQREKSAGLSLWGALVFLLLGLGAGFWGHSAFFEAPVATLAPPPPQEVAPVVAAAPKPEPPKEAPPAPEARNPARELAGLPGTCLFTVEASPASAVVTINGIVLGRVPVTTLVLCGKSLSLQMSAPGYASFQESISVSLPEARYYQALDPN